jgi:hypothetical protein
MKYVIHENGKYFIPLVDPAKYNIVLSDVPLIPSPTKFVSMCRSKSNSAIHLLLKLRQHKDHSTKTKLRRMIFYNHATRGTPLISAILEGNVDLVHLLLEYISSYFYNLKFVTLKAIETCIDNKRYDMLSLLLEYVFVYFLQSRIQLSPIEYFSEVVQICLLSFGGIKTLDKIFEIAMVLEHHGYKILHNLSTYTLREHMRHCANFIYVEYDVDLVALTLSHGANLFFVANNTRVISNISWNIKIEVIRMFAKHIALNITTHEFSGVAYMIGSATAAARKDILIVLLALTTFAYHRKIDSLPHCVIKKDLFNTFLLCNPSSGYSRSPKRTLKFQKRVTLFDLCRFKLLLFETHKSYMEI